MSYILAGLSLIITRFFCCGVSLMTSLEDNLDKWPSVLWCIDSLEFITSLKFDMRQAMISSSLIFGATMGLPPILLPIPENIKDKM